MKVEEGPVWDEGVKMPEFPALAEHAGCDVCVVGGGLCGMLCAYLLAKDGKSVVVLEKDRIGMGATGMTTGFLTQSIDTDYADLVKMFGTTGAQKVLDSHGRAVGEIERIAEAEKIACEFLRVSNNSYAADDKEFESLKEEYDALRELGAPVRLEKNGEPGFEHAGYLEFTHQAKFHPRKFLAGLVRAAQEAGVRIFEKTEALGIDIKTDAVVRTKGGTVRSEAVIAATYSPFQEHGSLYFKKGMYVSYVQQFEVPHGRIREAMYEDLANPYHYFRVDAGKKSDRLIVGGEDHRADIPVNEEKNYQALEEYIEKTFGDIPHTLVRRWSGPILEPIDGLPFIGAHDEPRILYAFGFSGNGMTYTAIAAMILRDSIRGEKNEWAELYKTSRIPNATSLLYKGRDYAGELIQGAVKNSLRYSREKQR